MTSNGSQIQPGRLNAPSTASRNGTRPQPCLPVFTSTSHARPTNRPRGVNGRLQDWEHLSTDAIIQRGAKASAQADASCGIGAFGNLLLVTFVGLAVCMAAIAIHQEQRMAPHERQLLERQR